MIICGEPYRETFKRYAKELRGIAEPGMFNGKPTRKPHYSINALANLFDKFADMTVPFRDLDRFCYFIIQGAANECEKDKYAPYGEYGFELFDCTFEQVFSARPELKPNGRLLSALNNLASSKYDVLSIDEVKVSSFAKDFTEEEILANRNVGTKTFRQIKKIISELGLSFRKPETGEETNDTQLPRKETVVEKGEVYYTPTEALKVVQDEVDKQIPDAVISFPKLSTETKDENR